MMSAWRIQAQTLQLTFQLLPAGLQPLMTDAPHMPTGLPWSLRALAALGYSRDSGVSRVLSTGSTRKAAWMKSLSAVLDGIRFNAVIANPVQAS